MESTKNILEFKNITKKYAGVVALDNVSLAFRAGEVHALAGENGAGKSTTMNIMCGVLRQSEGDVYIKGISMSKNPVEAKIWKHPFPLQSFCGW